MPFVKLDCGILDSTLWIDRPAREIFITALLMATPHVLESDAPQIEIKSLDLTGFIVPPGCYGFIRAAGIGIARRAGIDDRDEALAALERLSAPEADSRTPEFDGRRLARVDGGFIILNFEKYRRKDHTAAQRQRRYREAQKRNAVTSSHNAVTPRDVTQAEAEAEAEAVSKGKNISPSSTQVVQDRPASPTPNLPAQRDHNWVEAFIEQLETKDWQTNRPGKEAVVAFKFHRWMNKITNRQIFSHQRERIAIKLLRSYGLVRCLLAIQGQRTHPDFNQEDKGRHYNRWDNLFRTDKGFENIEKCSDHAIQRGDFKATLRALAQLQEERGWTPAPADEELFSTIGGGK